jgi:hypothetical protein
MPAANIQSLPLDANGCKYDLRVTTVQDGELMRCENCRRLLHPKHNQNQDQLYWERFESFLLGSTRRWEGGNFVCQICKAE